MTTIDLTPVDTAPRAALRQIQDGLKLVALFGAGWFSGVVMCVGMVKGWW